MPRPRARADPTPTALGCTFETPRAAANCAWERPLFSRTRTMRDLGSTLVCLPPPAFISRTPSRTSCHTSRSASNLANAFPVSFLPISRCFTKDAFVNQKIVR